MRRIFSIFLMLCTISVCAAAEIPCQCGREACLCFIQLGDEGTAVEFIQNTLVDKGYLAPRDDASAYDEKTVAAVKRFQEDNNLAPTGMMDDTTLTLLLWGMLPEELDAAQPGSIGAPVWIPTDGGTKHHREVDCAPHLFTINDPRLVSHRNAMALGFAACGICQPTGQDTDLTHYSAR